ncbi:hypothetical protein ANN_09347 [Periplaneta americana]|uniref:Uncharacterized protein n=1 Tax=Periplaneta americana TaxID=6978 RepID=A0ABQ8TLH0_PERAM|nr:hypothetical protein ANN_09347 [Periplaneta americana]
MPEAIRLVEKMKQRIKETPSTPVTERVKQKWKSILCKNNGYGTLCNINSKLVDIESPENKGLSLRDCNDVRFYRFAPITSCDVKRNFSQYTAGYKKWDHERKGDIMGELQLESVINHVKHYQNNWINHLHRMHRDRIPKVMLHCRPNGKRFLGRPKKRWIENSTVRSCFPPKDEEINDSASHKRIRELTTEAIRTEDDKLFTREEILYTIKQFNPKKAPGEDGLTSEILLQVFKAFPAFMTEIYNKCLKESCFPQQWKKSNIVAIIKPGKEEVKDVSKYRPISLLNEKIRDDKTLNIYLNNKRLEQVSELKYLGIYLDNKFNFDKHVDYITEKCTPIINMLARVAKLKWGLEHRALKTIYMGAIEPVLTYGAPIWEKALTKQNNLRKYQRVQRLMNIKIAKAFRTLSYDASCVIAGVLPVRLVIEEKVRIYRATHKNMEYDAPLK